MKTPMFLLKAGEFLHKNKSTIKLALGSAMIIGGTVGVGIASTKIVKDIELNKADIDNVVESKEDDSKYKRHLMNAYLKGAWRVVKRYGIPVGIEIGGLFLIFSSYKDMKKLAIAAGTNLAAITAKFADYRKAVKEEIGNEKEEDLYRGIKTVTKETVLESGKVQKEKVRAASLDPSALYSYWYDNSSKHFDYEMPVSRDLDEIRSAEYWFDSMLQRKHIVKLNDVLYYLGYEMKDEFEDIGWFYDPEDPTRDNCVMFNAEVIYKKDDNDEIIDSRPYVHMNFNVDGYIRGKLASLFDKEVLA